MDALEAKRWLRRYDAVGDALGRLIILPHAGGSASYYRGLSAELSHRMEVLVVRYPGRQDRHAEPGLTDLLQLAEMTVDAIVAQPDGRSLAIFGHSMGATLGFEITRRLEAMGRPVSVLFASGRPAPSRRPGGLRTPFTDERLLRELRALGGTDPRVLADDDMRQMILSAMRADYRAIEAYEFDPRPTPRVACAVTAMVGTDDPTTARHDLTTWAEHTTGRFSLRTFPGAHFYMSQQWDTVAAAVMEDITYTLEMRSPLH